MANLGAIEPGRKAAREPGLDLLRSLAILLVALFHMPLERAPEVLGVAEQCGWMGVDLFFVLSGFLIGSQLLRPYLHNKKPLLWAFYLRRAFRVLPAFWVVLFVYVLVPGFREQPNLPELWRFLTFTQNLGLEAPAAFSHAWSLCVEEHFYLFFPILVLWLMRKPSLGKAIAVAATIFIAGLIVRWIIWAHYLGPIAGDSKNEHLFIVRYWGMIYFPTYARLDGLLVGVLLAGIRIFRPDWWSYAMARRGRVFVMASILLGLAIWSCWDLYSVSAVIWGFPLIALGFGFLVVAVAGLQFRVPGATIGATLAYSTYLTHKAVMHLDRVYLGNLLSVNWLVSLAIYAVSSLIVALALYLCVEGPFLRLRERIISAIRARKSALATAPGLAGS
ncbi:MAG TPA: acyltransferase [Chthoniobacterales bacterium]|nr:acyltransferase [Chthoniobacterales bacterium]